MEDPTEMQQPTSPADPPVTTVVTPETNIS